MAEIGVIIYVVFYSFFLFAAIGLFFYRFIIKPYWKTGADNKQPACAQRVLFFCVLCYTLAAFCVFLGLIMYLIFGFPTEGATASVRSALTVFYFIALFLMLYVWIQRIQITFTGSAYEYSPRFLLITKGLFWSVLLLGLLATILFILNDGGNSEEGTALSTVVVIVSGLAGIAFFALLGVLIYTFIARLNKLRKIAENRLSKISESGDYDFESLEVIQKLVKLQLKLTICSVTAIMTSLFAIPLAITNDGFPEFMIYGPDCIIGFICMYLTIKANAEAYEKICKFCIITCNCCFNTTTLDQQIGHHIEVHSRSLQTSKTNTNAQTNTGSGGSGGSDGIVITTKDESQGQTVGPTSITSQDQATPRPSGKHRVDDSMPVDSVGLSNEQSEITERETTVKSENSQI